MKRHSDYIAGWTNVLHCVLPAISVNFRMFYFLILFLFKKLLQLFHASNIEITLSFQMGLAVLCCHQNGVAHRDPKVGFHFIHGNSIVVTCVSQKSKPVRCVFIIRVADCGLNTEFVHGAMIMTVCVTSEYFAPEVFFS